MSAGSENLKGNQRQLDMDGCEVGVSRQAVDETLEEYAAMLAALKEMVIWMPSGCAPQSKTKAMQMALAAIAKAEGPTP